MQRLIPIPSHQVQQHPVGKRSISNFPLLCNYIKLVGCNKRSALHHGRRAIRTPAVINEWCNALSLITPYALAAYGLGLVLVCAIGLLAVLPELVTLDLKQQFDTVVRQHLDYGFGLMRIPPLFSPGFFLPCPLRRKQGVSSQFLLQRLLEP